MDIINTLKLNCNPKIEINFDGGKLSSDSGLFLLKEFLAQIGFLDIITECFSTTDTAKQRKHSDIENLLQSMYQIFAGYFEDDRADNLTNEPVFTTCLGKMLWLLNRPCPDSSIVWTRIRLTSLMRSCVDYAA